jgi:hypothetical protein
MRDIERLQRTIANCKHRVLPSNKGKEGGGSRWFATMFAKFPKDFEQDCKYYPFRDICKLANLMFFGFLIRKTSLQNFYKKMMFANLVFGCLIVFINRDFMSEKKKRLKKH